MNYVEEPAKREIRSFLMARDPSIDRRFRPRPESQLKLFDNIEEEEYDDGTSVSSTCEEISSCTMASASEGVGALVYLRLRPVANPSSSYTLSENGNVLITGPSSECASTSNNKNQMEKHYSFSEIFTSQIQQRDVFEKCIGKKIEDEDNFTVLTYGTSGSGKTFTLLGNDEQPGIIPRALENIFTLYAGNIYPHPSLKIVQAKATVIDDIAVAKENQFRKQILGACANMNSEHNLMQQCIQNEHHFETLKLDDTSVFIWISFVEIYNEFVYDLLAPPQAATSIGSNLQTSKPTQTRKNMKIMSNEGKVFIKGLTSVYAKNSLEALKLLHYGLQRVNYASTSINTNSSRSHCVFTLDVLKYKGTGVVSETSYTFCDLAGSERLTKTGNIGSRLKEAQRINTSLLVLGRCLDAANINNRKKIADVIPIRESKLTMLLQSALLGKEKLAMIVNVTPTDKYYEENLNVLSFSSIAKNIIYKQPALKQNSSRFSWFLSQAMSNATNNQNSNADHEYMEQLLEENILLRNELDCLKTQHEEELYCLKTSHEQELDNLKTNHEQELEQREQDVRNELVDLFKKEMDERKKHWEDRLIQELESQKRFHDNKIDSLKRKYEAEIEDIRDEWVDDVDETETKKRRSLA